MSLIRPASDFILGSDRRCIVLTSKESNSWIISANFSFFFSRIVAGEGFVITSCFMGFVCFSSVYNSGDFFGDELVGVLITKSRMLKELSLCKCWLFLSCFVFPLFNIPLIITISAQTQHHQ